MRVLLKLSAMAAEFSSRSLSDVSTGRTIGIDWLLTPLSSKHPKC